ncbi:MAG: alanine racemase [Deltaproteobacteria bacterium]|nr:alanine racemase [Deltaproteobacteria bacterium]
MPSLRINLEALRHNAEKASVWAQKWSLTLLPVLKGLDSHPRVLEVVAKAGFLRFGFSEIGEASGWGQRDNKVLIQICPPSRIKEAAELFGRSFQAEIEVVKALDKAAEGLNLTHEVFLTVDLGDAREGLNLDQLPQALEAALTLKNIKVLGFAAILSCLSSALPDSSLFTSLEWLVNLARAKGLMDPLISLGGSVMLNFVESEGLGPITEIRAGDPFLLGRDIYRQIDLPGGPYRPDVCEIQTEIVEIRLRQIGLSIGGGAKHACGQDQPPISPQGPRLRALLELGRFHVSPGRVCGLEENELDQLICLTPGCFVTGLTAGYIILDVTDCPLKFKAGDKISFVPGYWAAAQAVRSASVKVEILH